METINAPDALPARFIAFAGTDGSGKTTQAELAGSWLRDLGYRTAVVASQSPSFTRRVLTDMAAEAGLGDHMDVVGPAMTRFVGAMVRYRDWNETLLPALERDDFVVVDRYVACFYASVRAMGTGNENLLRRMFRNLPVPHMTILVRVEPETALERLRRRGVDHEYPEYLKAFAHEYDEIPESENFTVIDGSEDTAAVGRAVRSQIARRFPDVARRAEMRSEPS
ncbi:dTMP kinase [Glycomyces salinus]|uniref:dTMP kinase n=1 Tax=Glycomyces salinus TaxID=980294 RepID=UPI0018ED14A1|nr:dTMP kinase [Glycomyces salinus]